MTVFVYFIVDELGVEQCRWYDGSIAARDGYVADDLISGLLVGEDEAIAEVQRIHGRARAAGQGLDDIAAALNTVTDDEEMDDSAAADRPIAADEMEGFVEFLAEYGV